LINPMPTDLSLQTISSRLDRVFESSRSITDDEIKSHYSRYLCVLTSGYLEESIKIIFRIYISSRTHPTISNYVISSISKLTNLKTEKIGNFLNSFNSEWKEKFETMLTDEEKDSVNSVVANRHLIAHGQNVGVSFVSVNEWYKNIKKAVEKVSTIVNP
jgi:hypothetical protein